MSQRATTKLAYRDYIQSDAWKSRRVAALRRASARDSFRPWPKCEVCGKRGTSHKNSRSSLDSRERRFRVDGSNGLHVHHLHYRTLGSEEPDDLIVLCTDSLYLADYFSLPPGQRDIESLVGKGCHERAHSGDPVLRQELWEVVERRKGAS